MREYCNIVNIHLKHNCLYIVLHFGETINLSLSFEMEFEYVNSFASEIIRIFSPC